MRKIVLSKLPLFFVLDNFLVKTSRSKPIQLPFPNLFDQVNSVKNSTKWVSKPCGTHVLANMAKDLAAGKATYLPNQTNILSIHCDFLFTTVVLAPTNMVSSVNTS